MKQFDPARAGCKARLILDQKEKPVQVTMSAQQAADLAFIVSDFAQQVEPNCLEVERLIAFAASIGGRLDDLVTARAMMLGESAPMPMAEAG